MSNISAVSDRLAVSLTDCDREPIHILGHVQDFGFLIAVTSDWTVARASANVDRFLDVDADTLVGSALKMHLDSGLIDKLRGAVRGLKGDDEVKQLFSHPAEQDGRPFDWAVHCSGDEIVIEAEPSKSRDDSETIDIPGLLQTLGESRDIDEFAATAAEQVAQLTGFDRVMVYRFGHDGSGEVIGEERAEHLDESFLGLRYPRTDIPEQARELYKRNIIRIISDVNEEPVPILPPLAPQDTPIDLSMSKLRAVSRIHIEYLQNMGVGASLSISILVEGRLWGMFVCHHYAPRILTLQLRAQAELYGQLSAFVLERLITQERTRMNDRARRLHDRLMAQVAEGDRLDQNFETISRIFRDVVECDGLAVFVEGHFECAGTCPPREQFEALAKFLNTRAASRIFHTSKLRDSYPAASEWEADIAGILAIPVSRKPRDYIVCFREEVAKTVSWAGNPQKVIEDAENGYRLSPRKSFALWKENVKGEAKPWSEGEIFAAEQFRVTLLEVILRLTDAAAEETARANEKQELLIAELNHRVRNILNLIRGLIAQSRSDGDSVESFSRKIGGRVHALARAHDQVTQERWAPAPLKALIETEKEAYLDGKADRVAYRGDNVLLKPAAFTAVSLVVHELMTNSVKYGALSDSSGRIEIEAEYMADDSLDLSWREIGGPPVQAPSRKGFGTTIIEKSIPFELGGDAQVEFKLTGLRAGFNIPASHVAGIAGETVEVKKRPNGTASLSGEVLVLEDNMIIAMDAEDMLRALGASEVHVAGKVPEALRIVEEHAISFALLDVNLGSGTSEDVAAALDKRGIPFAFATGYGDAHGLTDSFPKAGLLQKPIDEGALADTVGKLVGG